jgi:Tol biopolymer transport system component
MGLGVVALAALAFAPAATRVDDGHAAWSASGRYVAFDRTRQLEAGYTNTSIYLVRSNGRGLRHVTQTSEPVDAVRPVWSPNGAWIAFDIATKYLPVQLWWMRRNGRDVHMPLAGGDTSDLALSPSWSPDSRQLAFAGRFAGTSGVYVAERDTGRARLITPGDIHNVAWSPDGRWIAFADSASVALVPPTGGRVTRLAAPPGRVAWSPDGRRLAWATVCSVGVVPADAIGVPPPLSSCPAETEVGLPTWAPDGKRFTFSACRHLVCSVLVVATATNRGRTYVARGRDPAWSPDGRTIAYTRLVGHRPSRIHLIRSDGTHDRPLLRSGR